MTRIWHRSLLVLLLVPSLAWARPARTAEAVDAFVERLLGDLDVPGLAVGVVSEGRVVLAEGYGVRRIGEPAVVDRDTIFGIASNSKAFTAAALAILVEGEQVRWDDRVIDSVPELQMWDPWVTRELTVRDLVTHRSGLGLGAGDLMWWPPTTFTRDEIIRGIRHLEPASSFRSRYAYNNVMFIVAGEVVERVSGQPWGGFLRERILDPLHMARTTTSASASVADGNVATPHLHVGGVPRPVERMSFENAAGAVGVNSSVAEMARWLEMLLECRRPETAASRTCVLEAASIEEIWTAQTVKPRPELPDELESLRPDFDTYGLGFGVAEYLGERVVSHSGAVPGYFSRVALVPDARLGIVVLTNQESRVATDTVTQHLLDVYLRPPDPPVEWLEVFRTRDEDRRTRNEAQVSRAEAARDPASTPSLPLAGYAGTYRDPWYGDAVVSLAEGGLMLDMTRTPGLVADLRHWQHDTFVARWRTTFMSDRFPYDAYVTFGLKPSGAISTMTLAPVSPAIDFSFDFQDLRFEPVETTGSGASIDD